VLGQDVRVVRNDVASAAELLELRPAAVVIGPGPGRPSTAGCCPQLLAELPDDLPLLGVCLGHQALVEHHGGRLERDELPTHGRASPVHHLGSGLFAGLPDPFPAGRYHSLRARRDSLPDCLRLCAWTADGLVMGVEHRERPHHGVQFHPESMLTEGGHKIFEAFVALI